MPYSYLPERLHHRVREGLVELVLDDDVIVSMTPEEARSNAQDLISAADQAAGVSETAQVIYELQELIKHDGADLSSLVYRALLLLLQR